MAIASLDAALAGMQAPIFINKNSTMTPVAGVAISMWSMVGTPSSGTFSATVGGGQRTSTTGQVQGQIYHANPGSANAYLARFEALCSGGGGVLILADRLLDVGQTSTGALNVTITTSTLNSTGINARDNSGSSAGVGVMLGFEVNTVLAGAGGQITASYTNSTGTAGHTATSLLSTGGGIPAAAPVGSFFFMGLAAGDIGVQSIQTVTLSTAWTSGSFSAVLFRPIASLELPSSGIPNAVDALTAGFPQIFNGSVPFLIFIPSNTNTPNVITGHYIETQG